MKGPKVDNLEGRRVKRLVVVGQPTRRHKGHLLWPCVCDCGNYIEVPTGRLTNENTGSCGCAKRDKKPRHGHAVRGKRSRAYRIWCGMKKRCLNPQDAGWKHYGGNGVGVCERWLTFENFLADMGEPPPNTSLDRYPNNTGDYSPDNCRWATRAEQSRNTARNCYIEHKGETRCLRDWATVLKIKYGTLIQRKRLGWSESMIVGKSTVHHRSRNEDGTYKSETDSEEGIE